MSFIYLVFTKNQTSLIPVPTKSEPRDRLSPRSQPCLPVSCSHILPSLFVSYSLPVIVAFLKYSHVKQSVNYSMGCRQVVCYFKDSQRQQRSVPGGGLPAPPRVCSHPLSRGCGLPFKCRWTMSIGSLRLKREACPLSLGCLSQAALVKSWDRVTEL